MFQDKINSIGLTSVLCCPIHKIKGAHLDDVLFACVTYLMANIKHYDVTLMLLLLLRLLLLLQRTKIISLTIPAKP